MGLMLSTFAKPQSRRPGSDPIVFVVDDDLSVRESLELLLRSAGWHTEVCASAMTFLTTPRPSGPSCLVLDMSLPDLNGLELQKRIAGVRPDLPIIFLTGQHDVRTSVRAMKAGAMEFLTKPFGDTELLSAVGDALERSRVVLGREAELRELEDRYESLTTREREVMALVVAGRLNKHIAADLCISEITVKAHRGKVMRKMKAASLADLVKLAGRLRVPTGSTESLAARRAATPCSPDVPPAAARARRWFPPRAARAHRSGRPCVRPAPERHSVRSGPADAPPRLPRE